MEKQKPEESWGLIWKGISDKIMHLDAKREKFIYKAREEN